MNFYEVALVIEKDSRFKVQDLRFKNKKLKMEEKRLKRVSDLLPKAEGEYVNMRDLEDKDFTIHRVNPIITEFGEALIVNVELAGVRFYFITSTDVVSKKLTLLADKVPFIATVYKPEGKRYWDIK